ncbi:FimB/Mfa2 family fimbrial subunit [Bacteroides sp.]|uniref:FimB/Mfa2 family fimbrial subunit n=1 Tax=Bacteroides sp. TaxID=29523 RepID=UPI002FCC9453
MKKKSIFLSCLCAAMVLGACSEKNEVPVNENTEKSSLTIKLALQKSDKTTRAAQSTAIPVTSWSNIKDVQLFLYDASNVVRYSDVIKPTADQTTFTYTDVPVGAYQVVLVANTQVDNAIATSLDGGTTLAEWTKWNVRQKSATGLLIKQKMGTFPADAASALSAKTAYVEPSEVFMGEATNVTIYANETTILPPVALKREVSLMRLRLAVKGGEGTVNDNIDKGVDFSQGASIMIHRLPDNLKFLAGEAGGVSSTSTTNNILSIHEGNTATPIFNTANPTTGYTPMLIADDQFTLWRDVIVFPNNGGRANNALVDGKAAPAQQYFVVISGKGKIGHVLADGTSLTAETTVYWSGVVTDNFSPNVIREVNLSLKSGGTTLVPVNPTEFGGLTITVGEPAGWDNNIVESTLIL